MKKAVNFLLASCLLGTIAAAPAADNSIMVLGANVVEAAPTLAYVTGAVKDDHGAPVVGALVALLEPQPRGREIKSVKTDAQGKFTAGIVPGIYGLRATAEGFIASLARVNLDRPARINYDFALKRTGTLVQKRGDSDDYRWIARSVPRSAMNLQSGEQPIEEATTTDGEVDGTVAVHPTFHGAMQFVAASTASSAALPSTNFYGTNFAVSGTFGNSLELALIGQRGAGQLAPQRMAAIASLRPAANHQVTATIGYGQTTMGRKLYPEADAPLDAALLSPLSPASNQIAQPVQGRGPVGSLDQVSVSAVGSWQVFQPLLVIYGFDYSRFSGLSDRESVLPRLAVQYDPSARLRLNAAVTPGTDQGREALESFNSENIQPGFERSATEIGSNGAPLIDRSRRMETGFERLFGEGESSIEASAFYDIVSGHGVGVLALPLEASPETKVAFQQAAHQMATMHGAARGLRVLYNRRLNNYATVSAGYSFGRGTRLNDEAIETLAPSELFRGAFFNVASAKLDLDFTQQTGTHVSAVVRLSPSAVVFAIDPFAGRMSVYDPNISIYVTQELPNLGLPVRWQAIFDVRNLLDQSVGVEDGPVQLIAAHTRRTVRGALAFRW